MSTPQLPTTHLWHMTLSYKSNELDYQRATMKVAVQAPTIEAALEVIKKKLPDSRVWQINHGGLLLKDDV